MNVIHGDCFLLIKDIKDNTVDLVLTSPPYSDIVSYGKNISIKKPSEYCDWIIPLLIDIERVLKKTGSFILNINDKCIDGFRSIYIYELISRINKETNLKLYDTYIWHKKNGMPNGSDKRFRNTTEFIFHFTKDKNIKFYMERVLEDISESSVNRYKSVMTDYQGIIVDGRRQKKSISKKFSDKRRPENVFRFRTASASRDNLIKHPAPFHKELPMYFINFLTDKNDLVLDPFSGIGTTGIACSELGRNFIGFELNEEYVEYSKKRIEKYE